MLQSGFSGGQRPKLTPSESGLSTQPLRPELNWPRLFRLDGAVVGTLRLDPGRERGVAAIPARCRSPGMRRNCGITALGTVGRPGIVNTHRPLALPSWSPVVLELGTHRRPQRGFNSRTRAVCRALKRCKGTTWRTSSSATAWRPTARTLSRHRKSRNAWQRYGTFAGRVAACGESPRNSTREASGRAAARPGGLSPWPARCGKPAANSLQSAPVPVTSWNGHVTEPAR